jgi:hypothetical protein
MKVGDLVKFVEPTHRGTEDYVVREDTSGIVLGFHETKGRVKVRWFTMGATPTPVNIGYWPWGSLKVYSAAQ